MKTFQITKRVTGAIAIAVLALGIVSAPSQVDQLKLVPPESQPTNGSFYSLQNPDYPPLPFNLFPELPLYWLGDDVFAMDDREVDYQTVMESSSGDGPLGAAGVCGDVTFPVVTLDDEFVVTMSLTNLDAGIAADVFAKDWLDGEIVPWRWIARGTNGQVITFTNGT